MTEKRDTISQRAHGGFPLSTEQRMAKRCFSVGKERPIRVKNLIPTEHIFIWGMPLSRHATLF